MAVFKFAAQPIVCQDMSRSFVSGEKRKNKNKVWPVNRIRNKPRKVIKCYHYLRLALSLTMMMTMMMMMFEGAKCTGSCLFVVRCEQ